MKILGYIISIILFLSLVVLFPETMISPGPLLPEHQNEGCWSCHQPLRGVPSQRCMDCHRPDSIGIITVSGKPAASQRPPFHAELRTRECLKCHQEHQLQGPSLTPLPFEHELLKQSIQNNCASCHQPEVAKADFHRWLPNTCGDCHQTESWKISNWDHVQVASVPCQQCHQQDVPADPLHGTTIGECKTCHSVSNWQTIILDHRPYFRLDRHHPPKCLTCHTQPPSWKVYSCYECHEHRPRKIAREHREEGIWQFENCVQCHRSSNEREAKLRWRRLTKRQPRVIEKYDED